MRYLYKRRFLQAYDSLPEREQELVRAADRSIREYHATRRAPYGLRIKKLYQGRKEAVFEARPSLALRMVWAEREDIVAFVLLGTHDQVRRYLKGLV